MGARLHLGTRWFDGGWQARLDDRARLEIATLHTRYVDLVQQLAEARATLSVTRAIAGVVVMKCGGSARVHQSDVAMAVQVMERAGGLVVKDEPGGFVSVRVGEASRILVPGARMPRG